MNKVIVKFNSKQIGTDSSTIKTKSIANHHVRKGISYYIYKERILDDGKETSTMLKLTKDSLTLTRSGNIQQQQIFALGKTSTSDYVTPYGNLKMTVKTNRFELVDDIDNNRCVIKIDYELYLNNNWQSNNKLIIDICPAN